MPTSLATSRPSTNTADILALARQDIHNAVGADDDHRRRQYALSAATTPPRSSWTPAAPVENASTPSTT